MGLSYKFEKLSLASCNQRSFENKMACYSLNFGKGLQMMVGIGKEYGFTLNFDMLQLFPCAKRSIGAK